MNDRIELLKKVSVFSQLNDTEIVELAGYLITKKVSQGRGNISRG